MAKRGNDEKKDDKLQRTIRRNWIICGVSAVLIILLTFVFK
ncbi:MAG: hypothetical protein ACI4KM_02745 [Oscillospiraceae bacterium]